MEGGAGRRTPPGQLGRQPGPLTCRQMATFTLHPKVVLTARAGRPRSLNSLEKDCVSAIRGRSSATTMHVRTHDRFTPFVCGSGGGRGLSTGPERGPGLSRGWRRLSRSAARTQSAPPPRAPASNTRNACARGSPPAPPRHPLPAPQPHRPLPARPLPARAAGTAGAASAQSQAGTGGRGSLPGGAGGAGAGGALP